AQGAHGFAHLCEVLIDGLRLGHGLSSRIGGAGSTHRERDHTGSQENTSVERSSGVKADASAPLSCWSILSAVHASARWSVRTGRGWLNRKISLLRTPKICPVMPSARSLPRYTASGAIFSGVISRMRSTRAFSAGVSDGIESIMRVKANGAMQFERNLKRSMSSAIARESPTMPNFAAM